jgi:iron uptake system EfeUOB component EfeO/EfeM
MEDMKYISPDVKELEIYPEGVLCGSNEIIDEIEGVW